MKKSTLVVPLASNRLVFGRNTNFLCLFCIDAISSDAIAPALAPNMVKPRMRSLSVSISASRRANETLTCKFVGRIPAGNYGLPGAEEKGGRVYTKFV
jgi:hypothetical protein